MSRTAIASPVLAGLLVFLLGGCDGSAPVPHTAPKSAPQPTKNSKASTTKTYTLAGVVKRVNPKDGQVVIAHKAIPGFMEAMTMPFTLKDHALLEDVRPGDEVEGPLRVDTEEGT